MTLERARTEGGSLENANDSRVYSVHTQSHQPAENPSGASYSRGLRQIASMAA